MIKKLLPIVLCLCTFQVNAQYTFSKIFKGTSMDKLYSVCPSSDGGYVFTGHSTSFGSGVSLLVKMNASGTIAWAKHFGSAPPVSDQPLAIQEVSSGGYILAGQNYNGSTTDYNPYMVRISNTGSLLWKKNITGTFEMFFQGVAESHDGGFVFCGSYSTTGAGGSYNGVVTKTDSLGTILWTKRIGSTSYDDYFYSIGRSYDKGFIISGYSMAPPTRHWLVKIDSTGNTEWVRTFASSATVPGGQYGSVKCTTDSCYIFAGNFRIGADYAGWLIKIDSVGNPLWNYRYDSPIAETFQSVDICSDNGFIVSGEIANSGGTGSGFLLKTDSNGQPEWSYTYADSSVCNSVRSTADGGFITVGTKDLEGSSADYDGVIIKTDAFGDVGICNNTCGFVVDTTVHTTTFGPSPATGLTYTSTDMTFSSPAVTPPMITHCSGITTSHFALSNHSHMNIFPNPFRNSITIETNNIGTSQILIYNVLGETVFIGSSNEQKTEIDPGNIPAGVYFVKITSSEGIMAIQKIIKQ